MIVLNYENTSGPEVFFNDFTIEYKESNLIQTTACYPYGMIAYTWIRDAEILNRYGFQGKEWESKTQWYDFHARQYDPVLGRWFALDPANQFVSGYIGMGNNPVFSVDPDGKFAWIPIIIGAVAGAYNGGTIANDGQMNPLKWDYSSGRTWGYMLGGAVVGGLSGYVGADIATSGMPFANTTAIAASSFVNSVGTVLYTGGKTDLSINFGALSYNFSKDEFGYLGKEGNSTLENIGYGFGALANASDLLIGFKPGEVELRTENDPGYTKGVDANGQPIPHKDLIGHSQIVDKSSKKPLIDWGPSPQSEGVKGFGDWVEGTNSYEGAAIPSSKMKWDPITVARVNVKRIENFSTALNAGGGKYNLVVNNCVSQTSRALNMAGAFNIGIHPYLLHAQMYLRSIGVRPSLFSYHLNYKLNSN